jgi:hypothetical protein
VFSFGDGIFDVRAARGCDATAIRGRFAVDATHVVTVAYIAAR